ncbi:unnamed protein product [Spirodela intermedia]|uniref:Uncharacterized protein n=1 Tax=Spirodela intermedia TaxID=51605 RepID=A0A7I8JGS9_SPIIN|nr:unnamed protein product [Spirodela intermedia]CAA6668602.1 unnamed protein product [Spirodela intermedia]
MAVVLEELIRSIEVWLGLVKKQKPPVNPKLDPVLLVPGIAGTVLHAVGEDGKEERVWVRILGADHEFRTKLWSRFDPSTGQTSSLDEKTRIFVPEDRYGLSAIDNLDPDVIIGCDAVCYYHDMIEQMLMWGFEEGKTLFGFGYDFRQSNRLEETMNKFLMKLESAYTASGGRKVRIISHSMGGVLVKCFMSLHSDVFKKYVDTWIAIAAPFQGAPGYITTSLLNGMSFVDGWEQNFFISKWSMHQLVWEYDFSFSTNPPVLQVWREKNDSSGNLSASLDSHEPVSAISVMKEALCDNTVSLHYGSQESPISDLRQILTAEPNYIYLDGDGTVPMESSKADGLDALARVGVPADHRGIVCDRHVFRILKHWLKAGEPDPFYNPLNDYVILPVIPENDPETVTAAAAAAMREDWEIVSFDESDRYCSDSAQQPVLVAASPSLMWRPEFLFTRKAMGSVSWRSGQQALPPASDAFIDCCHV